MKNILVPTGFSAESHHAFEAVLPECVTLRHAFPPVLTFQLNQAGGPGAAQRGTRPLR